MFRWSNLIIVALTQKCNMNCQYCYLGDKSSLPDTELDFNTYKTIINKIAIDKISYWRDTTLIPRFQVLLHGGEPTLVGTDKIRQFLDYGTKVFKAFNLPFEFSIQTNGTNLSPELLNVFKEYKVQVGISVDSITNNLRDCSISQKKIIENINLAKELGVRYGTVSVFTSKDNIDFIKDVLDYKGISCTKINYMEEYYPNGLAPSTDQYINNIFIPFYKHYINNTNDVLYTDLRRVIDNFIIDAFTYHDYGKTESTCRFKFCGSGIKLISILPNGMFHLCDHWRGDETFYDEKVYQVGTYDFLSLKQFQSALNWSKKLNELIIKKGCDSCIYSYICLHECPLASIKRNNNWSLDTRDCEITKAIYNYLWDHIEELLDSISSRDNPVIHTQETKIYKLMNRPEFRDNYKFTIMDNRTLRIRKA